jgi:hypothetical protein
MHAPNGITLRAEFKRVKGYAAIKQVVAAIEAQQAEGAQGKVGSVISSDRSHSGN